VAGDGPESQDVGLICTSGDRIERQAGLAGGVAKKQHGSIIQERALRRNIGDYFTFTTPGFHHYHPL
jgi:hypothetical protein